MESITPKIRVLWHTPEPAKAIAFAARTCYTNLSIDELAFKLTDEEASRMVSKVLENHHLSTLRHAVIMIGISGVGRAFSHQLVRHGPGNAYEQRSQHYRTEKDFQYVIPETVPDEVRDYYESTMRADQELYDELMRLGVPKDDARQVLPNACETQLVWTMNFEAAYNFCQRRCCRVNTKEILDIAIQLRKILIGIIPEMTKYLGPTCFTTGICYEGEKYFKECNAPWHSPTLLYGKGFPDKVRLVGVGGRKLEVDLSKLFADLADNPEYCEHGNFSDECPVCRH